MWAGQTSVQPATNGAGEPVQELSPREVLDAGRPKALGGLQVRRCRQGAHGLQRSGQEAKGGGDDVHVLRQGDVQRESKDYAQVGPPEEGVKAVGNPLAYAGRLERPSERGAHGRRCMRPHSPRCFVERLRQQRKRHQRRYHQQDDRRLRFLREVEAQAVRLYLPSSNRGPREHHEEGNGQHIQVKDERLDPSVGEQSGRKRSPRRVAVDKNDVAGQER